MGSDVMPAPGWYADPADPKRSIRYWDGSSWVGKPALRQSVRAGESIQRTGRSISSIGAAITWIAVGIVALIFMILLIA